MHPVVLNIVAACSAFITVCGALAILIKIASPALKLAKRVSAMEQKHCTTTGVLVDIRQTNTLLCKGVLHLLDHSVKGNSADVEKLEKVKEEIQQYLIERR